MMLFWKHTRLVYILIALLAVASYISLFSVQAQKNPLLMDEVDYFQSMENINILGLPIYYAGEVHYDHNNLIHLGTRYINGEKFDFYRFTPETGILKETFFALTDKSSRYTYGMWHPPLYIYLGSFWLRIFSLGPDNSWLLRYFNMIFSIGIFAGIILLSRIIYQNLYGPTAAIALLLYSLNGLVIRGATLIDYNGTLSPFLAIWFLIFYLRSQKKRSFSFGLTVFSMLNFYASLGVASSLLISAFLYALIWGRHLKTWKTLSSVIFGIILFIFSFWIFCRIEGLPFSQPFLHNFQRVKAHLDIFAIFERSVHVVRYSAVYAKEIGYVVTLVACFLWLKLPLTRDTFHSSMCNSLPLTVIIGFLLHSSLRADAYGFPKYILFVLPFLFLFIGGETVMTLNYASSPFLLWRTIAILLLFLVVFSQIADSVRTYKTPGGTLYFMGEQGIIEISQSLENATNPGEIVLARKDIGFFAGRRFYQISDKLLNNIESLYRVINEYQIRCIASHRQLLDAAPTEVISYLQSQFSTRVENGDFVLLCQPK